jgi:hypothetical protein
MHEMRLPETREEEQHWRKDRRKTEHDLSPRERDDKMWRRGGGRSVMWDPLVESLEPGKKKEQERA